ncbi:MAG: hypothetical protein ACR2LA_10075, partial [Acidimicrobiales bacterium]
PDDLPTETGRPVGELQGSRVSTGSGVLELAQVQPEGRGRVPIADWVNGARPGAGERLGTAIADPGLLPAGGSS